MSKPKGDIRKKSKLLKHSSNHSQPYSDNSFIDISLSVNASKPVAKNNKLKPGLYIIATPIGNSRDITLRALDTLHIADLIVCEDTRITSKLLTIHHITRPLMAYHEHNSELAGPKIINRLKRGEVVALVSDAGTPLISDPGFRLVQACARENIYTTHLPGASSVLTILVLAGLPTDRFLFAGFPPNKVGKRKNFFESFKFVQATLIFFENPKRLIKSLNSMAHVFGPRDAAVGRELTKKFEEVRKGSLQELNDFYTQVGLPKGEVTIVISPPTANEMQTPQEDIDNLLKKLLAISSLKDAVSAVVKATGAPKREVYARALELSNHAK
jgi:16S rRNA (cytidine1402-2'-O)-methyltransferase